MSARGITIEGRWADLNRGGGMAAKAKVFMVNQEYKADKKVYFVDYAYKEKNAALISPGELVRYHYQADTIVFIVDQEHKADIKIMRKNFPK